MLVGKQRRPLGVGQEVDDPDLFKKSGRFRKQDINDGDRRKYRQEAAAQKQPLNQHFFELDDFISFQHRLSNFVQTGLIFALRQRHITDFLAQHRRVLKVILNEGFDGGFCFQ